MAALCVACCLLFADRAQALDILGHTVFDPAWFGLGETEEDPGPDAQTYEIEFLVSGDDPDLTETLQNASVLYSDQDSVPTSTAAFLARGRNDYQRLLAALYGEGRYGGTILITANGRPVEKIEPDAQLSNPAQVTVRVDPGPVFVFGDVRIANRPPPVPYDEDVPPSPEELGLVSGAIAKSAVVLKSEDALVGTWREHGHPLARIAKRETTANQRRATLDVTIVVEPGPSAVFGPLTVSGTERMNPDFVAWYTAILRGKPYDPDDVELARKQLRRLEVFQSARVVEADALNAAGELPIDVTVSERKLRVFGVGGTYSTLDGLGLEGYWQHRNLFGQAERLRFDGRIGRIGMAGPEDYDYFAGLTFIKPGVGTPFTDFEFTTFAKQEAPESYTEQTVGGAAGFSHRFSQTLEGSTAISIESTKIEDPLGERNFLFISLPSELVYDGSDDELDPTRGYRAGIKVEPFTERNLDSSGVISRLDASTYIALDPQDRYIFATRGAIGSLFGASRDDLPASKLFFAGGGGSVRGYAYRNIGPRVSSGEVVGGRSLVEASAELRAKVTEEFSVVPFVDAGNAYASSFPDFSEDLFFGAGVGIRYETGFGPLRLDAAVPLDPREGDPDFALYVGLGQAF